MLKEIFHQIWGVEGTALLLVIDPRHSMGAGSAKQSGLESQLILVSRLTIEPPD